MSSIIGLDPSLTHTAGFHALGEVIPKIRGFALKSKPKAHENPLTRLRCIRAVFEAELAACEANAPPGLLFVEGYAFGAKYAREALGELGGMLRLAAFERGWSLIVVPPTVLKAYVTGKGTAPKELMILECYKRWEYEAPDNNAADAYALMRLGLDYVAHQSGAMLPKRVVDLLGKLDMWQASQGGASPNIADERA